MLWSPHELRVESRDAIPMLAKWLAGVHGVTFRWDTAVHRVAPPIIETSRGPQGADGSLVVGDSHHYDAAPFAAERVNELLLDEYRAVTGQPPPAVRERWMGTYAVAEGGGFFSLCTGGEDGCRRRQERRCFN